jgi:hypothetical protein
VALDAFARPRFAKLSLRTDCPRCGAHLPVNEPAQQVECSECGQTVPVPPRLLADLLEAFEERWPSAVRDTRSLGDLTWRLTAEPFAAPPCPACDGTLVPVDGLGATCGSCGLATTDAPPPDWLSGETQRVYVPIPGETGSRTPIALSCPSCGAGLSVDAARPRLTPCDHCGSQVHLPELVWRQLHPKRTVAPWIARFDRESRPERRQKQAEVQAERDREKKERDGRKRAEAAQRKAKADAEESRRAAERAAAKAKADAEKAEQDRRWSLWTAPLAVLGVLLALSATGAMALGLGVDVWHALTPAWRISKQMGIAADAVPVAMAAYALGVWAACVVLAVIRGRTGLFGTAFWSGMMMLLAHIPLVGWLLGLYWAWEHVRDREPTTEVDAKLPLGTGAGLALLYLTVPIYDAIVFGFLVE